MGIVEVSEDTREVLESFASKGGDLVTGHDGLTDEATARIAQMFQMVAATHEFQRA
jgi:DNA invertase Pin-like site-specific DNA recombinase